jgi:hypothetical protein
MRIIFIFTLLSLPTWLFAQGDYVIHAKGDTLKGKLSFNLVGNIEQVLVKAEKRQTISAISVREVMLKGIKYKPVQFAGTVKFMQILTDGYLSLLAYQPANVMNYDGRLLQKRDGQLIDMPSLGFKKQMSNFLIDNPGLASQIQDGTLGRNDLSKIIFDYNSFISGKTDSLKTQYKNESKQKSKLDLLTDLKTEIEKSDLESKQNALDMITDMEGKIKANKEIPSYLANGLQDMLKGNAELKTKLDSLLAAKD